jgi:hypothetical protein
VSSRRALLSSTCAPYFDKAVAGIRWEAERAIRLSGRFALAAVAAMVLSLPACGNEGPAASPGIRQIVSTTSFGMCVAYCSTRLEISEGKAVLVRSARGGRGASDLPDQRFEATLTESEWREIARLAENTKLDGLPPVIGCPDCADGGAESLSIVGPAGAKEIKFDHGAMIEQAQPLLERVRALRTKLTPKTDDQP